MIKSDLIGIWKLINYLTISEDGKKIYPYGEDAVGYLIYTPYDYVSVHIMRAHRTNQVCAEGEDANIFEKIETADNFGGYVGRYEIHENTVIHYPEICGFVSYIKVPQVRRFKYSDNRLILDYEYISNETGKKLHSELVWERMNPIKDA